jgi:hypothetical protein
MVHIWKRIFFPATALAGAGVMFLAIGAARPAADRLSLDPGRPAVVFALAWTAAWILWVLVNRPRFGASD